MRFHRRMSRIVDRKLQKYKHQVYTNANAANMSGITTTNIIVVGLDNPVLANPTNVTARARVKGFYFELTVNSTAAVATTQQFYWNFQASPQSSIGAVNPTTVGTSASKNYVFKSGVIPVQPSSAPAKIFGFVKIPSKYQRFMNTDVIYFNISSLQGNGATDWYNLMVVYKEIRG